jgi:hypothetical protein
MTYKKITVGLMELISDARNIIDELYNANELINKNNLKKDEVISKYKDIKNEWCKQSIEILIKNDLLIEVEEFYNYSGLAYMIPNFNIELTNILNFMKNRKQLLIDFAKKIESINKEVVILKIDDFDNFEGISEIKSVDILDYAKDCFLEDDIKKVFLEKIGEAYEEPHSASETRDLFTDRILYEGKRLSTVCMFKGRGQHGELTIEKCGLRGNQLLKLAKNNSAECFIVQHTNKINPDVRECLQDHVLQNTRLTKIYICFVDGIDTARLLKFAGKCLETLKNKKSE